MTHHDGPGQRPKSNTQMKAEELLDAAFGAFAKARVKAGELAHENRAKIEAAVEKAGHAVDERTGGKYADQVAKVKAQAVKGIDLVERQRAAGQPGTGTGAAGTGTPGTGAGGAAGSGGAGTGGTAGSVWSAATSEQPTGQPTGTTSPAVPMQSEATVPVTPTAPPPAPTAGWHREPNGEWVRDES